MGESQFDELFGLREIAVSPAIGCKQWRRWVFDARSNNNTGCP